MHSLTFHGIHVFHGYRRFAVFKVPTNRGEVFMSISRTNYCNDERAVVEVDTKKFFDLWKNEPSSIHAEQAHGDVQSWKADRKYSQAARGFSHGFSNPVPLADIGCIIEEKSEPIYKRQFLIFKRYVGETQLRVPFAGFTNGVTRTIWLAANGASYFPVSCRTQNAPLLHELAGTSGSVWTTVDKLIPDDDLRVALDHFLSK